MSSSLGAIPRAESPVDFDKLEAFASKKCSTQTVVVNGLDEVPTYIDTKTRLIRLNFPPLPEDPELRKEALLAAGKLEIFVLTFPR